VRGAGAGREGVRVLLVDDEADYRETLAKVLRRRGMSVAAAGGGAEALDRLGAGAFDVVLLDLRMPGLDGLATLREIRRRAPGVRVVLLTGHGTAAAGLEAIRAEAFDFLLKPVPVDALVRVLEAAGGEARRARGR